MAEQTVTIKTQKRAASSKVGVSLYVDTSELKTIGSRLRKANPELAKQLRLRLRGVGDVVAEEAEARASEFSTTIPGSIKVRTSGFSVKVVAGGPAAPVATPMEHNGQAGPFRHPVFGNTDVWVNQASHPFLAPSLDAKAEQVEIALTDIIDDTLREVGII